MINNKIFNKIEKIFFFIAILASLWPVLCSNVFAMLDAPAHMYNTKLIYEVIFKQNEAVKEFYIFNPLIVPNWTGHVLLLFLFTFFNGLWTQKIFIIIYLVFFPLSFRYLIRANKGNITLSYFAFPLSYSFFFFLGFFNFLIGLPIMFFGMAYWLKNYKKNKWNHYLILALFSLLVYFSHPILFAVWCLFIALLWLYELLCVLYFKNPYSSFIKNSTYLISSVLPSVILAFLYIIYQPEAQNTVTLSTKELFSWILNIRSILVFSIINELKYSYVLTLGLLIFTTTALAYSVFLFIKEKEKLNSKHIMRFFWFDLSLLILIMYLILPDETNGGGFISSRLNFMFFISFTLGLASLNQFKFINIIFVALVLFMFHKQLFYYYSGMALLNKNAETLIKINDYIDENACLISVDKTQNWMQGHLCNYVGVDKTVIMQHNYEASKKYFPLIWNTKQKPELFFGNLKAYNPCVWLMPSENGVSKEADYVLIYGNNLLGEPCDSLINNAIESNYTLYFKSSDDFVKLYKKSQPNFSFNSEK